MPNHRKPDKLKRLQGTLRKDRVVPNNLGEALPKLDVVIPPAYLNEDGKKEWRKITGQLSSVGMLHEVSLALLGNYCTCYELFIECTKQVEEKGITLLDSKGKAYRNPAVAMRKEAMQEMRAIAAKFGFTPADVSKIDIEVSPGS